MIEIGKLYHFWKVLKEVDPFIYNGKGKGRKIRQYECLCTSCNKTILVIRSGKLGTKGKKACYACYAEKKRKYPDYISRTRREHFSQVKGQAKRRKISFNLDIKQTFDLLEKQGYKCSLSGMSIDIDSEDKTASIDRKNSSKGYIRSNIQWVHKDINVMKGSMDMDYFLSLCNKIIKINKINNGVK